METQIKQVNDYFVQKLMNQDFELTYITSALATVLIDAKYQFTFWIANSKNDFECYKMEVNFMDLDFTPEQREFLYTYFRELYTKNEKEALLEEKERIEKKLKNYE